MFILVGFLATLLVIAIAALAMGVGIYNGLVSLRQQVDRAWANIDVILKQRHDELPQIISVLEQFASYERGTIDRIVEARTRYGQAQSLNDKVKAAEDVSQALRGVLALGEAYPELKSSEHFLQLQRRISALESQIADRREMYNEGVTNLNTRIQQIPDVIVARFLGYNPLELFRAAEAERATPSLKLKLPT